ITRLSSKLTDMSDAAADAAPITEQEILSTYRRMQSEMQGLVQNLTKIEMERNEHRYVCAFPLISLFWPYLEIFSHLLTRLVEETLEPLDPDRRAFRLVGGVLVERTVREVLPTVKEHRKNLDIYVQNLKDKLDTTQKEAAAWKAKYNIKTQEEMDASSRQ
ncbi:hypothetical protein ACHAXA_010895, partial [Cyclostephanos tholiformis]